MNTFFNIYLICAIFDLILFPGIWDSKYTDYINKQVKKKGKDFTVENQYIGGIALALTPLVNVLFAPLVLIQCVSFNVWKNNAEIK